MFTIKSIYATNMSFVVIVSDFYQHIFSQIVRENLRSLSLLECPTTVRGFVEYVLKRVNFYGKNIEHIKDNKYFAIVTHTLTSKSMSPDGIYDAWIVREVQITVPIKDIPGCYNRFKLYENIFDSKNSICNLATSLKKGSHMIQTYEPIDPIFYDDYNIIELLKQNGAAVNVVLYNFSIDAIAFMKDPHPELYM